LGIKVIDLGIGTGVGVDVHMHKVECELMGGSREDKVRIWTDVPLHYLSSHQYLLLDLYPSDYP
jgi:hypothetical protein